MRRLLPLLHSLLVGIACCTLLLALAGPAAAQEEAPAESFRLTQSFSVGNATWVSLELSVGDLEVRSSDGPDFEVDLEIECTAKGAKCEKLARALKIDSRRRGDRLEIRLKGPTRAMGSTIRLKGTVLAPRRLPLAIELGVGDLEVSGFTHDLRLEVGVGNLQVRLPESAVRIVDLDTNVGKAALVLPSGRLEGTGLVGKALRWTSGRGSSAVELDVNVGNIEIVLY